VTLRIYRTGEIRAELPATAAASLAAFWEAQHGQLCTPQSPATHLLLLLEPCDLLSLLHFPARPHSKVVGDPTSMCNLDLTLVKRTQWC
jgi:hypothetical protein